MMQEAWMFFCFKKVNANDYKNEWTVSKFVVGNSANSGIFSQSQQRAYTQNPEHVTKSLTKLFSLVIHRFEFHLSLLRRVFFFLRCFLWRFLLFDAHLHLLMPLLNIRKKSGRRRKKNFSEARKKIELIEFEYGRWIQSTTTVLDNILNVIRMAFVRWWHGSAHDFHCHLLSSRQFFFLLVVYIPEKLITKGFEQSRKNALSH